jgi:hypothetical protein
VSVWPSRCTTAVPLAMSIRCDTGSFSFISTLPFSQLHHSLHRQRELEARVHPGLSVSRTIAF